MAKHKGRHHIPRRPGLAVIILTAMLAVLSVAAIMAYALMEVGVIPTTGILGM